MTQMPTGVESALLDRHGVLTGRDLFGGRCPVRPADGQADNPGAEKHPGGGLGEVAVASLNFGELAGPVREFGAEPRPDRVWISGAAL